MTTKTTEHTPGPWEARRQLADGYLIKKEGWEIRTDAYDVATWIERGAPIRREGDAHLIAAAPDLLEACKNAMAEIAIMDVSSLPRYDQDRYLKAIQTLSAAIAKARGA